MTGSLAAVPGMRRYAHAVARGKHPPGSEPFDVTLPDGFESGEHRSTLEEAAKQAGWTIEERGTVIAIRDIWTENEGSRGVARRVEGGPLGREGYRLGRPRRVTETPPPAGSASPWGSHPQTRDLTGVLPS